MIILTLNFGFLRFKRKDFQCRKLVEEVGILIVIQTFFGINICYSYCFGFERYSICEIPTRTLRYLQ